MSWCADDVDPNHHTGAERVVRRNTKLQRGQEWNTWRDAKPVANCSFSMVQCGDIFITEVPHPVAWKAPWVLWEKPFHYPAASAALISQCHQTLGMYRSNVPKRLRVSKPPGPFLFNLDIRKTWRIESNSGYLKSPRALWVVTSPNRGLQSSGVVDMRSYLTRLVGRSSCGHWHLKQGSDSLFMFVHVHSCLFRLTLWCPNLLKLLVISYCWLKFIVSFFCHGW